MVKTIIQIDRNPSENNNSVLRRFSRKVRESGVIRKVKSLRYNEREVSKFKTKKDTLRRIIKRKRVERLRKLGKIR